MYAQTLITSHQHLQTLAMTQRRICLSTLIFIYVYYLTTPLQYKLIPQFHLQ